MNESELEENLRRLQPLAPSPGLEERIAMALESGAMVLPVARPTAGVLRRPASRWSRLFSGLGWAGAGAAAGVAAVLLLHPASRVTPEGPGVAGGGAASVFERAESAREIVSSEESSTVYDDDDQPTRLVRYSSIERHTWTNPATGAELLVEVPREDVVAVPVSYQ